MAGTAEGDRAPSRYDSGEPKREGLSAAISFSTLAGMAVGLTGVLCAEATDGVCPRLAARSTALRARIFSSFACKLSPDPIVLDAIVSDLAGEPVEFGSLVGFDGIAGSGGALSPSSGTECDGTEGRGLGTWNGAMFSAGTL